MAFEDYDAEFGYSLSELTRSYSRRAYALSEYELRSIDEVEKRIRAGRYSEKSECLAHANFLESIQKRLSMIMFAEERESIMNWELREVLQRVRMLSAELSALVETLPSVVVYAEKVLKPEKAVAPLHPAVATHPEPMM